MNFQFKPYVEEGTKATNAGHVVHLLELHLDEDPEYKDEFEAGQLENGEVGYIKVTYIPEEVWERRYAGEQGFLRFMGEMKGWCRKLDQESKRSQVHNLSRRLDTYTDRLSESDVEDMTDDEVEVAFDHYMDELRNRYGTERENAQKYHVDKPRVEFIRVAENYRRQGYGTALYRRMAEIMNEHDMPLCSTNLQRDPAEKTWEAFVQKDWAQPNETQLPFTGDDRTRYELFVNTETKVAA